VFIVIGSRGDHYTVTLRDERRTCQCLDHRCDTSVTWLKGFPVIQVPGPTQSLRILRPQWGCCCSCWSISTFVPAHKPRTTVHAGSTGRQAAEQCTDNVHALLECAFVCVLK
jgi:hypothetical protein